MESALKNNSINDSMEFKLSKWKIVDSKCKIRERFSLIDRLHLSQIFGVGLIYRNVLRIQSFIK